MFVWISGEGCVFCFVHLPGTWHDSVMHAFTILPSHCGRDNIFVYVFTVVSLAPQRVVDTQIFAK